MSGYTPSTWAVDNPADSRPSKRRRSSSEEEDTSITPRPYPPRRPTPAGSLAHLLQTPSAASSPSRDEGGPSGSVGEGEESGSGAEEDDEIEEERPGTALNYFPGTGGDWTYRLEVLQQPQRARACGFGDKDRRPLSPPPIVRLWVHDASGKLVDPSHVSVHFLVLMVDLWSADGTQQRNVVMHPASSQAGQATIVGRGSGSTQDYPEMGAGPSSRPSTGMSRSDTAYSQAGFGSFPINWHMNPGAVGPSPSSPGASPLSRAPYTEGAMPSPLMVASSSGWPPPHQSPSRPRFPRTHSHTERFAPADSVPSPTRPVTAPSQLRLGTSASPYQLPSLSSIADSPHPSPRPGSSHHLTLPALRDSRSSLASSSTSVARESRVSFSTESSRGSVDHPPPSPHRQQLSSWAERPRTASGHPNPPHHQPLLSRPSTSGGIPLNVQSHPYPASESSYGGYPRTPEAPRMHLAGPSPNYSRVLVGSLTSVCQRLQDSTGQIGLFFFAHDLGIRTEGVFTLKFSLTNLASLMQNAVMPGDHSRVLAQVQSDPFTVYSAKRFPGVIPTTDLTRLFARQNVRLPTRQKRTRGGSAESEGEGDDDDQ